MIWIDGYQGHYGCLVRAGLITKSGEAADGAPLRFLAALQGDCVPLARVEVDGRRKLSAPFWRPVLPPVTDLVRLAGWSWSRPYQGDVDVLDRSGSWIASASSIRVAHGALEQTGPARSYVGPGYYKLPVLAWTHEWAPHPIGGTMPAGVEGVWVPHPRAQLLWQLAARDLYPDFDALDSYTCSTTVRLDKWATHVQGYRRTAIERHGRDSAEYQAVKDEFAQSGTAMLGTRHAGQAERRWKTPVQRPDWYHGIQDLAACTVWRWCADLRDVAVDAGRPELAPVGIRNGDELIVPAGAIDLFTTTPRRGNLAPLAIDPSGIKLGSFKVKGHETWAAAA